MTLSEIKLNDIKVSERLRKLDYSKVSDLEESILQIGLLSPIIILLAGMHRLEAHRLLGKTTIECKRVNLSELQNKLVQIDENLIHNELNIIEKSEHIGSMYTIRTVLPHKDDTDERPTVVTEQGDDFILFSSKIGNCVKSSEDILDIIKNKLYL